MFNRDIIDLAMIRPDRPTLAQGLRKATTAYGPAVGEDAGSAISWLWDRDHAIERCRQALGMIRPRAVLVDRLRRLSTALTWATAAP